MGVALARLRCSKREYIICVENLDLTIMSGKRYYLIIHVIITTLILSTILFTCDNHKHECKSEINNVNKCKQIL